MKEYCTFFVYSKELEMEKRVYVYAPITDKNERFPVLYIHDGQNLFDDQTAYMNRSWRLLDLLERENKLKIIVVGIESDGKTRTNQLIPYKFKIKSGAKEVGGDADKYLDFITNTLKPLIDEKFLTKKTPEYTAMMGSSFGGVCSIYAALTKNEVFSKFASISGAYQFSFYHKIVELAKKVDLSNIQKIYMDTGTKETEDSLFSKRYIEYNQDLFNIFENRLGSEKTCFKIIEGAIHHESDWEKRFLSVVEELFGSKAG